VAAELIALRSGHDEQVVRADLHREFDRELAGGIRTLPGAAEILQLTGAKVPLGCDSNSWLASMEDKLRLCEHRDHFTALDTYAPSSRALGAEPSQALSFEDSGTGARAARDAGLRLIAVPAGGHPAPPADLALTDLTDPDLRAWIASW